MSAFLVAYVLQENQLIKDQYLIFKNQDQHHTETTASSMWANTLDGYLDIIMIADTFTLGEDSFFFNSVTMSLQPP